MWKGMRWKDDRKWNLETLHCWLWRWRKGPQAKECSVQFSHSVVSDSYVTPWIPACQASLYITNSWGPSKPMSIESVMPSNHLLFCHPLLILPSIFPSIRVFSSESALCIRWPKYWSFNFNISPSSEHPGLIFRMDWLDFLCSSYIIECRVLKCPIIAV